MCFFTSLSANAAAVAKRYSKQLDIIEAARQILAEQKQEERARQEAAPNTRSVSTTSDWPSIRRAALRHRIELGRASGHAVGTDSADGEARRCSAL